MRRQLLDDRSQLGVDDESGDDDVMQFQRGVIIGERCA